MFGWMGASIAGFLLSFWGLVNSLNSLRKIKIKALPGLLFFLVTCLVYIYWGATISRK